MRRMGYFRIVSRNGAQGGRSLETGAVTPARVVRCRWCGSAVLPGVGLPRAAQARAGAQAAHRGDCRARRLT